SSSLFAQRRRSPPSRAAEPAPTTRCWGVARWWAAGRSPGAALLAVAGRLPDATPMDAHRPTGATFRRRAFRRRRAHLPLPAIRVFARWPTRASLLPRRRAPPPRPRRRLVPRLSAATSSLLVVPGTAWSIRSRLVLTLLHARLGFRLLDLT